MGVLDSVEIELLGLMLLVHGHVVFIQIFIGIVEVFIDVTISCYLRPPYGGLSSFVGQWYAGQENQEGWHRWKVW